MFLEQRIKILHINLLPKKVNYYKKQNLKNYEVIIDVENSEHNLSIDIQNNETYDLFIIVVEIKSIKDIDYLIKLNKELKNTTIFYFVNFSLIDENELCFSKINILFDVKDRQGNRLHKEHSNELLQTKHLKEIKNSIIHYGQFNHFYAVCDFIRMYAITEMWQIKDMNDFLTRYKIKYFRFWSKKNDLLLLTNRIVKYLNIEQFEKLYVHLQTHKDFLTKRMMRKMDRIFYQNLSKEKKIVSDFTEINNKSIISGYFLFRIKILEF